MTDRSSTTFFFDDFHAIRVIKICNNNSFSRRDTDRRNGIYNL